MYFQTLLSSAYHSLSEPFQALVPSTLKNLTISRETLDQNWQYLKIGIEKCGDIAENNVRALVLGGVAITGVGLIMRGFSRDSLKAKLGFIALGTGCIAAAVFAQSKVYSNLVHNGLCSTIYDNYLTEQRAWFPKNETLLYLADLFDANNCSDFSHLRDGLPG